MDELENFFEKIEVGIAHPLFYPRVISLLCIDNEKENGQKDEKMAIQRIVQTEYDTISKATSKAHIQEPVQVRNRLKARELAEYLIGKNGELRFDLIQYAISIFEKNLYSIAPNRIQDAQYDQHMLRALKLLSEDKEIQRIFQNFTPPYSNKIAEQIIRDTILLDTKEIITDRHVKKACLSAWLTYLRQSVGSCFATAPAIVVQQEQPRQMLMDFSELMSTGQIKRIFAGKEYNAPLAISWGNGELKRLITIDIEQHAVPPIWVLPALITALDNAEVYPKHMIEQQKIYKTKKWLMTAFSKDFQDKKPFLIDCEMCLEKILMTVFQLTTEEVQKFRRANLGPEINSGSLIITYEGHSTKQKRHAFESFEKAFYRAKNAFKSFAENALLKAWEFTLASFSETTLDLCRYNLYTAIGVNSDQSAGVGQFLYNALQRKIDNAKRVFEDLHEQYEQILIQMQYLEDRVRIASTEKEIEWLKIEYQSRKADQYHIYQQKLDAEAKANKIAQLHQIFFDEFEKLFPSFFQEVYDSNIQNTTDIRFDDSPAGFRLIYKHGRNNPSLWTYITQPQEFIRAIVSFFTVIEQELRGREEIRLIEHDFAFLMNELIAYVQTDIFLESALYRIAQAYKTYIPQKPIENWRQIEKTPWIQNSGGSMENLLKTYFRKEAELRCISRWVESEVELLAYIIDTLRYMPKKFIQKVENANFISLLMHSPTHAFLLKPSFKHMYKAMESDMYSFSWIKQEVIEPAVEFWKNTHCTNESALDLIQKLSRTLPRWARTEFCALFADFPLYMPLEQFKEIFVKTIARKQKFFQFFQHVSLSTYIDSLLFEYMPYVDIDTSFTIIKEVFAMLPINVSEQNQIKLMITTLFKKKNKSVLSIKSVCHTIFAIFAYVKKTTKFSEDIIARVYEYLRAKKMIAPMPCIFADTNWVNDYFAFVISPTTKELQFWCVDRLGTKGYQVDYWKNWLNGAKKDPKWGIYITTF